MLKKRKLRAFKPGQWVRLRTPDYECWKQEPRPWNTPRPGDEIDVCLLPQYEPRDGYPNYFEWFYRVGFRKPGSTWVVKQIENGCFIGPWDVGLIDATSNSPNYDSDTFQARHRGEGVYLYEPASDDPEVCPGPDWSRYECSICGKFVKPFSNDQGELRCPTCEVPGLVILEDKVLDKLEQVREFARAMGLSSQLERQLCWLDNYADHENERKRQCILHDDFAPHSFTFCHYRLPAFTEDGARKFNFNGGLIYQGPSCPADGSFPSLTVSLAGGTGWFCHT
jgi:hypothetical protein